MRHHHHRQRCRRAPHGVVEHGEAVKAVVLPVMKLQVREVVRRMSGGAAARSGRAVRVALALVFDQRKTGRAAGATRPVVAKRLKRRRAGPGCRASRPCRPGCR